MRTLRFIAPCLGLAAVACAALLAPARAQAPGVVAIPVLVSPVSGDAQREAVVQIVDVAAGAATPVHTHPGDCFGFVIEGTVELRIAGKEPRRVSAGEAYGNLRGTVHQFVNVSDTPARLANTLLVDKGRPRTEIQPDFKQ